MKVITKAMFQNKFEEETLLRCLYCKKLADCTERDDTIITDAQTSKIIIGTVHMKCYVKNGLPSSRQMGSILLKRQAEVKRKLKQEYEVQVS